MIAARRSSASGLVARHATWPIPAIFDAVSFSVWCS